MTNHKMIVSIKKDKDFKGIQSILDLVILKPSELVEKSNSMEITYIFSSEEERADVWKILFWSDKKKVGSIMITEITDYIFNPPIEN